MCHNRCVLSNHRPRQSQARYFLLASKKTCPCNPLLNIAAQAISWIHQSIDTLVFDKTSTTLVKNKNTRTQEHKKKQTQNTPRKEIGRVVEKIDQKTIRTQNSTYNRPILLRTWFCTDNIYTNGRITSIDGNGFSDIHGFFGHPSTLHGSVNG